MSIKPSNRKGFHILLGSCALFVVGYSLIQSQETAPSSVPYASTASMSSTAPSTVPSASGKVIHLAMPQQTAQGFIEEARGYHTYCLHQVLDTDPEGKALLELFNERVGYALITGPKKLVVDQTEGNTKNVMIIVSSRRERAQNGFPIVGNWEYQDALRAIFAPLTTDYSVPWTGARLAHELMHAQHYLAGTMPKHPTDEQMLAEELRANRFELRLIDRTTKGEYLRQIDAWLASQTHVPDAPKEWYRKPDEALYQSLQKLFPESLSVDEAASRRGSLMATLNIRLGEKKGLSDDTISHWMDTDLFHPHN